MDGLLRLVGLVLVLLLLLDRRHSHVNSRATGDRAFVSVSQQVVGGALDAWMGQAESRAAAPGGVITCACRWGDGGGVRACLGKLTVMGR